MKFGSQACLPARFVRLYSGRTKRGSPVRSGWVRPSAALQALFAAFRRVVAASRKLSARCRPVWSRLAKPAKAEAEAEKRRTDSGQDRDSRVRSGRLSVSCRSC